MADAPSVRADGGSRTVLVKPVYDALKEQIMDRAVGPGAKLNIDALAARLGVSATPVREALARLAAERLVCFTPFKGYSVLPLLSERQLTHLFHVRRLLEGYAAREASHRVILADLRAMERELAHLANLHPVPRFQEYRLYNHHDQKFHELLVSTAGNQVLLATYRGLNLHVQLARLVLDAGLIDYDETAHEHDTILDRLRAHDAEGTVDAVLRHIDAVELRFRTALALQPVAIP